MYCSRRDQILIKDTANGASCPVGTKPSAPNEAPK